MKREEASNSPFIFATVASVVWIVCMIGVACYLQPAAGDEQLTLNAWGDFFAGASAPLAFLWLVVGYIQQGFELRQNTEALKLQGDALHLQVEELKASVEQQRQLVDVAKQDFVIARTEFDLRRRDEKLRAQPILRVNLSGIERRPDQTVRRHVRLVNEGKMIDYPQVEILNNPLSCQLQNISDVTSWGAGTYFTFELVIPAIAVSLGGTTDVTFRYRDALGDPEWQLLHVDNTIGGTRSVKVGESSYKRTSPLTPGNDRP